MNESGAHKQHEKHDHLKKSGVCMLNGGVNRWLGMRNIFNHCNSHFNE